MKGIYIMRAALSMCVMLASVSAFARPGYDGVTPSCEIPIFHYGSEGLVAKDAEKYLVTKIAGSIEATRAKWTPDSGAGDIAGKGMYFEGDPFSSMSYGGQLLIVYLKPASKVKDVRGLGELDNPETVKKIRYLIRGPSPLIVHSWISAMGINDAAVVRGKKNLKASELPFDLAKSEIVSFDTAGDPKPWKDHEAVLPEDSLSGALQKYSDRFKDLYLFWNGWDEAPSDDLVWNVVKSEISEAAGEEIGDLEVDKSGTHWEPFDSCDEFAADRLKEADAVLRVKGLVSSDGGGARDACDLKARMLAQFRRSSGYERLLAIYNYLRNYKRRLGIRRPPSDADSVSVFSATCRAD